MSANIELLNSFTRALQNGINLFLGAGFSLHASDEQGNQLPSGGKLGQELSQIFGVAPSLTLPQISTILQATNKDRFHKYLRTRFRVGQYDERYLNLLKINTKNIFTTNIDNLINEIYGDSDSYYINDVTLHGPTFNDKRSINYVPLHGSVLNENRPLIFTSSEIVSSFNDDRDTWQYLRESVQSYPTLFWGYSLADAGVMQSLFSGPTEQNQKSKWIVLRDANSDSRQYFKALGFNIIEADTTSLLDYIEGVVKTEGGSGDASINKKFSHERIPSLNEVSVRPIVDFYMGAAPIWWDIYSQTIFKTHHYSEIIDKIDSGMNTFVIGGAATGKTTLLMQVAKDIQYVDKQKLVILDSLTTEKASFLVKEIGTDSAIIFIDNFTDDIEAFKLLLKPNVQLVAFDREYNFEIISHHLANEDFLVHNVTQINEQDGQGIFNEIPLEIRNSSLVRSLEDTSLFEFVSKNINKPKIQERMLSVIQELEKQPENSLLDFFIMCCYVHSCRTPVSFDMSMAFLRDNISTYTDVYRVRDTLGSLILDYLGEFIQEPQDYFRARSTIVAETILNKVPSPILKRVLYKFYDNVSPLRICRYDIFKRNAYDYKIMRRAFNNWEEGIAFFQKLAHLDNSPYLLQQGALYLADKKRYIEAFMWIDNAISQSENKIFSIRNSHAIILFEANINIVDDTFTVRDTLNRSMEILISCYTHDKRKTYHAVKYADQALRYNQKYADASSLEYLTTAYKWLIEEREASPWSHSVRQLLRNVREELFSMGHLPVDVRTLS